MPKPYGIPTTYAGVRYRSRLEARWAVFFDLLRWKHVYEPEDFAGWIPDFAIVHDRGPTYVEVKPFYGYDDGRQYIDEFEGIDVPSGREVLLLGCEVGDPINWHPAQACRIGFFVKSSCGPCEAVAFLDKEYKADFTSTDGEWRARISGKAGKVLGYEAADIDSQTDRFVAVWKYCGNIVQWKAR